MKYEFDCILSSEELKAANYIRPFVTIPCDSDFVVSVYPSSDPYFIEVFIHCNSHNLKISLIVRNIVMFDKGICFELKPDQFNKLSEFLKDVI